MSELQPGMLALVINTEAGVLERNIGKIGLVIEVDSLDKGCEIQIKCKDLLAFFDGEFHRREDAWFCKSQLLPIKPEADPLDQKQQQELHA